MKSRLIVFNEPRPAAPSEARKRPPRHSRNIRLSDDGRPTARARAFHSYDGARQMSGTRIVHAAHVGRPRDLCVSRVLRELAVVYRGAALYRRRVVSWNFESRRLVDGPRNPVRRTVIPRGQYF